MAVILLILGLLFGNTLLAPTCDVQRKDYYREIKQKYQELRTLQIKTPMDQLQFNMLQDYAKKANHVLEIGAGGSTLLYQRLSKRADVIESDLEGIQALKLNLYSKDVNVIHWDVGHISVWGEPEDRDDIEYYLDQFQDIIDDLDWNSIDFIFVDGILQSSTCAMILKKIENLDTRILIRNF